MQYSSTQLLVIQHGTLIDGSGGPPIANDALVIDGNRIRGIGPLPPDIRLDRDEVHRIDATGQWIMPGLIDGHCHRSFGLPLLEGVAHAATRIKGSPNRVRSWGKSQSPARSTMAWGRHRPANERRLRWPSRGLAP